MPAMRLPGCRSSWLRCSGGIRQDMLTASAPPACEVELEPTIVKRELEKNCDNKVYYDSVVANHANIATNIRILVLHSVKHKKIKHQ